MASVFKCVNSSDLNALRSAAKAYGKMAALDNVKEAARLAGDHLAGRMRKMVEGEASLRSYADVGESMTVFEDAGNMVVGIPPNTPTALRADNMHSIFQVADVAADLARQSGDVEQTFYDELAAGVS